MEVSSESPPINNSTSLPETVWRVLNDSLNNVFADLQCPGTDARVRTLLDSCIRSSTNFVVILIPPFGTGQKYEVLQRQHAARATWLFGVLFHIVATPFSNEVLVSSIEIQSRMLRILAKFNLAMFDLISEEYMQILDELLDWAEIVEEKPRIIFNRFVAEQKILQNLNLSPHSVTIEASKLTSTLLSLMKIILKSGVSCWDQAVLWNRILRILQKAEPEVKLVALKIASSMITFHAIENNDIKTFVTYAIVIVKTIPSWKDLGKLNSQQMEKLPEDLINILENIDESTEFTDLCFAVVDLLSEKIIVSQKLGVTVCQKIRDYIRKHPRAYSPAEANKFLRCFANCPEFSEVLVHLVIFDVKSASHRVENLELYKTSLLWMSLRAHLREYLELEQYNEASRILSISRSLTSWLTENSMFQATLYNETDTVLITSLCERLETINCRAVRPIFQCLIDLMAHNGANRQQMQRILSLPWSQEPTPPSEGTRRLLASSKSLDVAMKAEAIRAISEFGEGRERMKLLSACVSSSEMDLSIAGVLNSAFLLRDSDISILDINTHILRPAFVSQRQKLQEAVAQVLSQIVCFVSGRAKFVRENWDCPNWRIECEICDKKDEKSRNSHVMSKEQKSMIDNIFTPFFNLLTSSVEVRKIMSQNLHRFSNHVEAFHSNKITVSWLSLIRDPVQEIRDNVSRAIGTIFKNKIAIVKEKQNAITSDEAPVELVEFVDFVVGFMAETLENALQTSDDSLHCTLITSAKEFGCVPMYLTERAIANIFFITISHPNSTNIAVASASAAYREVAACQNVTHKELYVRYKKNFLEMMTQIAVSNYLLDESHNMAMSLHRIAKCIGYLGSRQLMSKDGHIVVCFLISLIVRVPKARNLLRDIADLTAMDEREMLTEHFQHICVHVFLNETTEIGTECLKLVSEITDIKLPDLMTSSFIGIFRELLLHFHEKMERVVCCLDVLSDFAGELRLSFNTKENIINSLGSQLHAILVHFDLSLGPRSDEHTQKSALASLGALMRFMGPKHLTPLRYKILATLRVSLGFERPGFRKLSCYAWNSFLHNISLEDLGPLFPTICLSMTKLMESCPREAERILEYLLVENVNTMSTHIAELFFIHELNVSPRIAEIVQTQIDKSKPAGVEANLELWLRRIKHETDEVRMRGLRHLKKFLGNHRSELNEMILADTDVHPLIVKLLDALLAGCQDKDENIRLGCGECLGELGAVEPSLLPRRIVARGDSNFIADIDKDFAFATLIHLVRAFQMQKSTQGMGCFSLAIQEILKYYEISPTGRNSVMWARLPPTTQQIIMPFLNSRYRIQTLNKTEYPHPIYGTEAGSTFQKWAYSWVCSMTRLVNNENLRRLLNACHPAFSRDSKTMIFCIPYIVSFIVANGTESERLQLIDEILAVIKVGEASTLDLELIRRRPLHHESDEMREAVEARVSDEARRVRCSQVIFSTLQHLQTWLGEKRLERDEKYREVQNFFDKLDSLVLAQGCYQSYEYHRALMYLERHMASTNKGLSELTEGGLLAKIYTQLEEPDGVSGILATQNQCPTLQQRVLAHEVSGQLQDAATCYERLAQRVLTPKYLQGMIQCYLGLDQPFTAMNITKGVLNSRPELQPLMVEHEPFWRLAHFTHQDEEASSQTNVKRALLEDLKRGQMPDLLPIKKRLVSLLGAASHPGAYQQSYSYIMKLHILSEFEQAAGLMLKNVKSVPDIFDEWDARGQLVRASRGVEFVLGMRRATLDLAVQLQRANNDGENLELKEEIGMIWLKSAKIARKAGLYQQAYMYLLSASDSCPPQQLYIEQAQFYWQKNCQEDAFTTLKRCFANCFRPTEQYRAMPNDVREEERRQCAKAKLLFAKYNDQTLNVNTDVNIANYKEAIMVWCAWEKSLLACAQYYESVINRMSEDERDTKGRELQGNMINYYGKSLQFGCKYVHQSMPRMLTIWLDYASRVQSNKLVAKTCGETMIKMTKIIGVYIDRLPIFMWLTAFSQLVSRICHPAREVQNTLCTILVKLILDYPQHCLWMMASVYNSAYPVRQKRCLEILSHPRLDTSEMRKKIRDFNRLWEKLIELSNRPISDGMLNTTVKTLSPGLPRLLTSPDFGPIMMPTTKFRQLHLPSKGESIQNYNPFPAEWVHIAGIDEGVMVMTSLQRPRRIKLRGSDGAAYLFMCKPKDDLRRDFRLMEFNGVVNKYLQKDPESRQRRLYIRTYSVVPLNEECGLIEWVPNLVGFRPIILGLYKERGINVSLRELKPLICNLKDTLEKKRDTFVNKLLPKHPPALGDWFRLTFPDPYGWYEARTAYIRTTAVMSMVGYILGLGDRHGENILFDAKCGDCVHVDFNCLFNRGELFDWPERVPFRLTQNMLDAMGPLKYEGPFRRSCQTTMRVLREQASTLISVLTPFVYDPLVSWTRNQPGEAAEKTNEKAVEDIKKIEQRLKGLMRPQGKKVGNFELNLSVEGQTNHLILDATNVDNLCQMYFGWGPYL